MLPRQDLALELMVREPPEAMCIRGRLKGKESKDGRREQKSLKKELNQVNTVALSCTGI